MVTPTSTCNEGSVETHQTLQSSFELLRPSPSSEVFSNSDGSDKLYWLHQALPSFVESVKFSRALLCFAKLRWLHRVLPSSADLCRASFRSAEPRKFLQGLLSSILYIIANTSQPRYSQLHQAAMARPSFPEHHRALPSSNELRG